MIKLGCCLPGGSFMPEGVGEIDSSTYGILTSGCAAVSEMGYDYCEAAVWLLMKLTDAEFSRCINEGSLKIAAANSFIPGKYRIARLDDELKDFVRSGIERVTAFGGKIIVLGSGGARRFTEEEGAEHGIAALTEFLRYCDGIMRQYGVTLALEPLNDRETNLITTVKEGAELVRALNGEGFGNIKLLCDSYHMSRESDAHNIEKGAEGDYAQGCFEEIERDGDIIVHAHAAEPFDRRFPGSHDGKYVGRMMTSLKKAGYNGGVTVECGYGDFIKESKDALRFLRSLI